MTETITNQNPKLDNLKSIGNRIRKAINHKGDDDHEDVLSILKEFENQTQEQTKQDIIKEIEVGKKEENHMCIGSNCPQFCINVEYNNAVEDIINKIKEM